jgi:hypothetical protein
VRRVTLLNDVAYGVVNSSDATFLVLNRVELAAMRTMRLQVGFNTFLRNFYYNTSLDWFPLPKVSNCIASGFELVNETDFVVRVDYNPDVSLEVGVNNDYFCNLTFSTDIFQCQLMTNFTFNFSATILVTGTPAVLSSAGQVSVTVMSSLVAILSGGAALLQQSRAESLGQLTACQFSLVDQPSAQDCPLQIGFGSELQYYHRGCVIGNIGTIAIFLTVVLIVVVAASVLCRREVRVWEYTTSLTLSAIEDDGGVGLPKAPHHHEDRPPHPAQEESDDQYLDSLADALMVEAESEGAVAKEMMSFGTGIHDISNIDNLPNSTSDPTSSSNNNNNNNVHHHEDLRLATPGAAAAAGEIPKTLALTRMETFSEAFHRLSGRLSFPSIGALPVGLLADSTVLSSVRLLVHPIDEHDTIIGGFGVALYGVILTLLLVITLSMVVKRSPTPVKLRKTNPLCTEHKVGSVLRYWLLPTTDFASERKRDRHRYGMLKFIMEDSRYPVFIVCDLALSILIAGLVGVGISRRELCAKLAIAGTVGYGLFFLCVLVLRPDLTRLNLLLNISAAGLGFLSSAVTLVSMNKDEVALTAVGQYISLIMLVVILLQFIATGIALVAFARALAKLVRERRAAKAAAAAGNDQFSYQLDPSQAHHINVIRTHSGDEVDSCSDADADNDDIVIIGQKEGPQLLADHGNAKGRDGGGANVDDGASSFELETLPIFQELSDDDNDDDANCSGGGDLLSDRGEYALDTLVGRFDEEMLDDEEFDRIWVSLSHRSQNGGDVAAGGVGKKGRSRHLLPAISSSAEVEAHTRRRTRSMLLHLLQHGDNDDDDDGGNNAENDSELSLNELMSQDEMEDGNRAAVSP